MKFNWMKWNVCVSLTSPSPIHTERDRALHSTQQDSLAPVRVPVSLINNATSIRSAAAMVSVTVAKQYLQLYLELVGKFKFFRGPWNSLNPNQFMHRKRRLDDIGKSSKTIPRNQNIFYVDMDDVGRSSDTIQMATDTMHVNVNIKIFWFWGLVSIQNLILMQKLIRIHSVFLHTFFQASLLPCEYSIRQ